MQMDGQTDRTKISHFSQIYNMPKNGEDESRGKGGGERKGRK
jgi:hypothetical protein